MFKLNVHRYGLVGDSFWAFVVFPVLDLVSQCLATGVMAYAAVAVVDQEGGTKTLEPLTVTSSVFALYLARIVFVAVFTPFNLTRDLLLDGFTCALEGVVAFAAVLMQANVFGIDDGNDLLQSAMLWSGTLAVSLPMVGAVVDTLQDLWGAVSSLSFEDCGGCGVADVDVVEGGDGVDVGAEDAADLASSAAEATEGVEPTELEDVDVDGGGEMFGDESELDDESIADPEDGDLEVVNGATDFISHNYGHRL